MADSDDDITDLTDLITNAPRDEFGFHLKVTNEMGTVAASAVKEIQKLRAEADVKIAVVPARHRTYRSLIAGAVLLAIGWIAVKKLDSKDLSPVLVAVAVAAGAVLAVREYKKKKND